MNAITDQEGLALIDRISGDDFCEDLACDAEFRPGGLTEREKIAQEKLSEIYRIAHGLDRSNTCYSAHSAWRQKP